MLTVELSGAEPPDYKTFGSLIERRWLKIGRMTWSAEFRGTLEQAKIDVRSDVLSASKTPNVESFAFAVHFGPDEPHPDGGIPNPS